jgi:hypothetical protein
MSDSENGAPQKENGRANGNGAARPRLELVIRVMPDGRINVSGPIHDKMTCYAMLEGARDAIKDHVDKMNRSAIVPVQAADPFLMRRG